MKKKDKDPAGLPSAGKPAFLEIGKIRRPHGVLGDVLVELHTDFPEKIAPGKDVFIGKGYQPVTILRKRNHKDGVLLGFEGYSTPEQAGKFRNLFLFISASERESLLPGEYYFRDLIGIHVQDETGRSIGELSEIIQTGANDVYVVKSDHGKETLLPAISDVIKQIDLEAKRMTVHLLPGL
jgi:16S rRNA processing protein RimM